MREPHHAILRVTTHRFDRRSRFPLQGTTALRTLGLQGTLMAESERARSLTELSERLEELRRHL
jgi:hypothetical protein